MLTLTVNPYRDTLVNSINIKLDKAHFCGRKRWTGKTDQKQGQRQNVLRKQDGWGKNKQRQHNELEIPLESTIKNCDTAFPVVKTETTALVPSPRASNCVKRYK